MSGHETIRVLEVEVDASSASSAADGKSECKTDEGVAEAGEQPDASSTQDSPTVPQSTGGGVGKSLSSNKFLITSVWFKKTTTENVINNQLWLCSCSAGWAAGGVCGASSSYGPNSDPCCSHQRVSAPAPGRHAHHCARLSTGLTFWDAHTLHLIFIFNHLRNKVVLLSDFKGR